MGKYLKVFQNQTEYQSFINGDKFVTPNVSFAKEENTVFYNPYEEKINYAACFEEFYTIPSGIEVTIENKEKHIVGEQLDPYGNFRSYMIGIPENGLNITIHNNSDRQFYGGLTNEFNDGPFYMLAPNTEVIIQLYINSYGNVCAKGPDGRVGEFVGGNELETSVGLLNEYYLFLKCVPLDNHSLKYTAHKKLGVNLSSYQMGEEFADGVGIIVFEEDVTEIGYNAFSNRSGLTSIEIPASVKYIGNYVFENCSGLTSIYYNCTKSDWNAICKEPWWKDNSNIERIICTDGVIEIQNTIQVGMINVHSPEISLAVNESRFIGFNIMDTTWKGNITNAVENAKDGNYYYYEYDTNSLSVRTAHENMKGDGYYVVEVTGLQPGVYTLTINAGPDMKGGAVAADITVTVTE